MNFNTYLTRYGIKKSCFNEQSDFLFLSSSFCFKNSYQSEKFFKNSFIYNIYSRFKNPTLNNLQNKLSVIEKSRFCIVVSSGMASIVCVMLCFLSSGEILISSRNLFSATLNYFIIILVKFNIFIKFINSSDLNLFLKIFSSFSKLVFIESPSNPLMEILDIYFLSYFSKKFNKLFVFDNTFCTPVSQNPILYGVDIVLHSCSKFLDGQGRVLGGAIFTNNKILIKQIFNFIKICGFTLSAFNAWLINKSIESLNIRLKFQNNNSLIFLNFLKKNMYIYNIFYPNYNVFFKNIFLSQQILSGSIISLNVKAFCFECQRVNSWKILNYMRFFYITSNLGDIKTIVTHPSTTTHFSFSFYEKFLLTISESFLRLSLGLDDINDLLYDFHISLKK